MPIAKQTTNCTLETYSDPNRLSELTSPFYSIKYWTESFCRTYVQYLTIWRFERIAKTIEICIVNIWDVRDYFYRHYTCTVHVNTMFMSFSLIITSQDKLSSLIVSTDSLKLKEII